MRKKKVFTKKRVGVCVCCGMRFEAIREDKKTCSTRCRKRLERKYQFGATVDADDDRRTITINGVAYPANLIEMFSLEEVMEHTK